MRWIERAHAASEARLREIETTHFAERIASLLSKLTKGTQAIEQRQVDFADFLEKENQLFGEMHPPEGVPIQQRMKLYQEASMRALDHLYGEDPPQGGHWLHVSCTGYTAPSPLQKFASQKEIKIPITHLYHMGCYGALAAIRVAEGLLHSRLPASQGAVELFHTEFCTLHMNPALHRADQLVAQSLFADGAIRYRASLEPPSDTPSLKILAIGEHLLTESLDHMTWDLADWGFEMSLSRDVPAKFKEHLPLAVAQLIKQIGGEHTQIMQRACYAIHPGGPTIISSAAEVLQLREEQIAHTKKVFADHGNVSSATVPLIWKALLEDPSIKTGTEVISFAFGPGLTLFAALLRKEVP